MTFPAVGTTIMVVQKSAIGYVLAEAKTPDRLVAAARTAITSSVSNRHGPRSTLRTRGFGGGACRGQGRA